MASDSMQLKEDEEYNEDIYKGQPLSRDPRESDIYHRDVAQFGSAPALGAGCRRFESCHPDHIMAW